MRGTSSVTATITALRPRSTCTLSPSSRRGRLGHGDQVPFEDRCEVPGAHGGDLGQERRPSGEPLDRGHADLVEAAGDDAREVGEVRGDVESEAVSGDPTREVDADRSDLLLAR